MSEFGKGFTYCIGLFLAHAERTVFEAPGLPPDYSMWFNGAADHLYELETPRQLYDEFKDRVYEWQNKCIAWRVADCTAKDMVWAIQTAKDILREYDTFCGIETEKGEWE